MNRYTPEDRQTEQKVQVLRTENGDEYVFGAMSSFTKEYEDLDQKTAH